MTRPSVQSLRDPGLPRREPPIRRIREGARGARVPAVRDWPEHLCREPFPRRRPSFHPARRGLSRYVV